MDRILKAFRDRGRDSNQELNRSRYSLVSCGELSTEAVQVWMGLPDEVKSDPSLEPIRKRCEEIGEKENGVPKINTDGKTKSISDSLITKVEDVGIGHGKSEAGDISELSSGKTVDNTRHNSPTDRRPKKAQRTKYYVKMTLLLGCWVFFTTIFLMYNEKTDVVRNTAVTSGGVKHYPLNMKSDRILVKLSGPFISQQAEIKLNHSEYENAAKMVVCFEGNNLDDVNKSKITEPWTIILQDRDHDYNEGEERYNIFKLNTTNFENVTMAIRTTSIQVIAFTLSYAIDPLDVAIGVIFAVVLLCGLYVLIIFEVVNRTMAAIIISTTSLAALALVGERPSLPEIISWLDVETLLLLFSMMVLVAVMAETGIFDFLAVFTFEVTKGRLWPLIYLLCIITAVLSTFLDNVTTVLLMSPVTIRLCEVMDLDPVPILMFMAIYSNIGGTATPVGDPPNVIVASNKAVIQAGINFTNFTAHMALGILLVCIQTSIQIKYMFRDPNMLRLKIPREIQDLRQQISIWRRAADSLPHLSKDVQVVRERLERKIKKLNVQLEKSIKEAGKRACPKETFQVTLEELKGKYKIRDKNLLIKSTVAIVFVVTVFFMHSIPELNRVSLGWTALLGAILLLTLADREDLEPILHRVEWSTLLFFASLFVLMEALSKLGLILYIGGLMEALIMKVDESARLGVGIMLILWVSGIISGFVDNIPLTTMMVRVVVAIGNNPNLNLPLSPLIWALLYGACLGGNGTLIGASANVVCAGVAEQHGYKFTFLHFFKVGFPIMLGHLTVASVYLIICHCVFAWH
ncbi:P protein-like [Epargyreus clarus]|uniref:P protein-like n=1 Tax=Epargyreus clarus TaxID=520877 RepID=UPI003C2B67DD